MRAALDAMIYILETAGLLLRLHFSLRPARAKNPHLGTDTKSAFAAARGKSAAGGFAFHTAITFHTTRGGSSPVKTEDYWMVAIVIFSILFSISFGWGVWG